MRSTPGVSCAAAEVRGAIVPAPLGFCFFSCPALLLREFEGIWFGIRRFLPSQCAMCLLFGESPDPTVSSPSLSSDDILIPFDIRAVPRQRYSLRTVAHGHGHGGSQAVSVQEPNKTSGKGVSFALEASQGRPTSLRADALALLDMYV